MTQHPFPNSLDGPSFVIRDESGQAHWFKFHFKDGPTAINVDGSMKSKQPGPEDSFWRVVILWNMQGRRVDTNGFCIWTANSHQGLVHL